MRIFRCLSICVALTASSGVKALDWAQLHGHWHGRGEVSGAEARIRLTFREALNGGAHHLSFANDMQTGEGKIWQFRAEAIYQCDREAICRGHWYDSRNMVFPVVARMNDDALIVDWGDATTEQGRTHYRLIGKRQLEITDEVKGKDGVWKVFGRSKVRRR